MNYREPIYGNEDSLCWDWGSHEVPGQTNNIVLNSY
jgi:hypothetical protein